MKRILTLLAIGAALLAVSCGNNPGQQSSGEASGEEAVESARTVQTEVKKETPKAQAKKWYEQDFVLTEKMYVGSANVTRTYARKGNVVIYTTPGGATTKLYVCTDSTRTEYLIGNAKKSYGKVKVKDGFDGVNDAVYKYLKGQMSETVFGKAFKPGDEDTTYKDTTIFGRPAYVVTKETTKKNSVAEVWGKTIMHIDKETGLPLYKWGIIKTNGEVTMQGKSFEVLEFSTNPTYEGLIVSLDGLTEI